MNMETETREERIYRLIDEDNKRKALEEVAEGEGIPASKLARAIKKLAKAGYCTIDKPDPPFLLVISRQVPPNGPELIRYNRFAAEVDAKYGTAKKGIVKMDKVHSDKHFASLKCGLFLV